MRVSEENSLYCIDIGQKEPILIFLKYIDTHCTQGTGR